MSTNFLNRRMDLIHSGGGSGASIGGGSIPIPGGGSVTLPPVTDDATNYLTMDTSYPVKLAGKILKIFTACNPYNGKNWVLRNSEKETILSIDTDHVFDFAGRVIKNNIGEEKAYLSNSSVYKKNDYVMVIIDFDDENSNANPSIHLCSQTNFENFIVDSRDGDGNLKLFEIDGDIPFNENKNFDYTFNSDIFNEAVDFESEENKHAFVRFVKGEGVEGRDSVLYQTPENIYDKSGKLLNRRITPVAKIENLDINCLTAVVNQFIFPYMNDINLDEKGGTESINKLAAFMTFNGSMNNKFMDEFCYTEEEMLDLPIITTATKKIKHDMLEEYYNIPDTNKGDFKYVLMALVDSDEYSSFIYSKDIRFIPIRKSNNSFSSMFEINNRGFVVDGESIELPAGTGQYGVNVGQLEENDYRNCYWINHFDCGFGFRINNYDTDNINSINSDNPCNFYGYSDAAVYIGNDDNGGTNALIQGKDWDWFSESNNLAMINRFIDFFNTDDVPGWENFKNGLIYSIPRFMSETNGTSHYINLRNVERHDLPITVVLEYPEIYNGLIEYGTSTMKDYPMEDISNFTRNKVRFKNRISPKNHYENMAIAYNLFNTKNVTGNILNIKTGTNKKCEMYFSNDANEEAREVNYTYYASRNLSSSGTNIDNYNYGILLSNGNEAIFSPVKIVSVNMIGERKGNDKDYNPAEVSVTEFAVVKPLKLAKDYIYKNNETNNLYIKDSDDNIHELFVIARYYSDTLPEHGNVMSINGIKYILKPANTVDNDNNFKSMGTDWKGTYLYLYYYTDDNTVHRIKYYYRNKNTREIEEDYDYFTDNIVIDDIDKLKSNYEFYNEELFNNNIENLNRLNKENIYVRAFLNYKVMPNDSALKFLTTYLKDNDLSKITLEDIMITVAAVYGLAISQANDDPTYGIENVKHECDLLDFTCTYNLTIDIDDIIIYPGTNNDAGIYGYKQIRMSDMINTAKTTIHKNMMTPLLSSDSNSTVYNIKSYLDYIKTSQASSICDFNTGLAPYRLNINGFSNSIVELKRDEFYRRSLTCDLSYYTNDDDAYFDKVEVLDRALFKKELVNKIKFDKNFVIGTGNNKTQYVFKNIDDNTSLPLTTTKGIVLHSNINPKNIFDINKVIITDSESNDITKTYVDSIPIWVNHNQTGMRESYSIALNNGNPFDLSLLATTGNEGTIEIDDIVWNDLLVALSNNKEIDILSDALKSIKSNFKNRFTGQMQNISDTITMEENLATVKNANTVETNPDQPFPQDRHDLDKYRQPEGTPNGIYNDEFGIYEFFFGYGYTGGTYNRYRTLNNRGVIVFVSSEGNSYMQQGSGNTYDKYSNRDSIIKPKRMYINNDGLLCTKEYFDMEDEEYKKNPDDPEHPYQYPKYPETPTTLATLLKKIEALEARVAELESNNT